MHRQRNFAGAVLLEQANCNQKIRAMGQSHNIQKEMATGTLLKKNN